MNKTTAGWLVFLAAIGMMFSLLAIDIMALSNWNEITKPIFVGTFLGHIAAVIAAFVGGKLIPETRNGERTRATDMNRTDGK